MNILFCILIAPLRLTDVYGSKEHTSGHAWCPNTPIEESLREWIQAEFSDLVMIGAIFTAGRGDGNVSMEINSNKLSGCTVFRPPIVSNQSFPHATSHGTFLPTKPLS